MGGNSEAEAKASVQWGPGRDAIQVNVVADAMLNQYDGLSHTVLLNVVQVAEPAPFQALVKSPAALQKAIAGPEPPGILSLEKVVIEPGSSRQLKFDRVDKARYIGVIAAYYGSDTVRNSRLYQIGVNVKTEGIVVKTREAKPGPLTVDLRLGAYQVAYSEASGNLDAPLPPDQPAAVPVAQKPKPKPTAQDQLMDSATSHAVDRALKKE
ncbi:MAG TPA: type VI secretion lipoprotein TssJ [Burkholderiales bacterium]|nr:type VI secretion lipoprotein TssJ [Burkholderiales bacterium]